MYCVTHTCALGMTLKHAMTSLAEMFPNVALLRALPDMLVVRKALGVRTSWGVGPVEKTTAELQSWCCLGEFRSIVRFRNYMYSIQLCVCVF